MLYFQINMVHVQLEPKKKNGYSIKLLSPLRIASLLSQKQLHVQIMWVSITTMIAAFNESFVFYMLGGCMIAQGLTVMFSISIQIDIDCKALWNDAEWHDMMLLFLRTITNIKFVCSILGTSRVSFTYPPFRKLILQLLYLATSITNTIAFHFLSMKVTVLMLSVCLKEKCKC